MLDTKSVVEFQIEKRMFSLGKRALEELEKHKEYSLKLEGLLKNMGFEDKEFFMSDNNYSESRKRILDEANGGIREIQDLLKKFDIRF
jgi:hypothetical protein